MDSSLDDGSNWWPEISSGLTAFPFSDFQYDGLPGPSPGCLSGPLHNLQVEPGLHSEFETSFPYTVANTTEQPSRRQKPSNVDVSDGVLKIQQYIPPVNKKHRPDKKARVLAPRCAVVKKEKSCSVIKKDVKGNVQLTFRAYGRSRSSFDSKSREATALTRQNRACEICRCSKVRCDMPGNPYQPCGACSKFPFDRIQQPCIRVSILDVNLHRRGSTLNNNLQSWMNKKKVLQNDLVLNNGTFEPSRIICLTQDIGVPFLVSVTRFYAEPGDSTGLSWRDPNQRDRVLEMPHYYIDEMEAACAAMKGFVNYARPFYIEKLLENANPLVRKTFEAAIRFADISNNHLVADALRFWVATRLTEQEWQICGCDTLGLLPIVEYGSPWYGMVPVTPVMDTQLDEIVNRALLNPLKDKITKALDERIHQQSPRNWTEIFFTCFILMNNMEGLVHDIINFTTSRGVKPKGNRGSSMSEGYVHACRTLLAYYHFACQGSLPLRMDWSQPQEHIDAMTRTQSEYLSAMQTEILCQENELRAWKTQSMYSMKMYWCSQMLFDGWRGDIPHAGSIDDFTEEDLLTT